MKTGSLILLSFFLVFFLAGETFTMAEDKDIEIVKIVPNKILYKLGESGNFQVRIRNRRDEEVEATLKVVFIRELNTIEDIYENNVKLPARTSNNFLIPWKGSTHEYGYEVIAKLLIGDKILDEKNEYFIVSNNPFKVGHSGGYGGNWYVARENCITWTEFVLAVSDAGKITPDGNEKVWYNNQSGHRIERESLMSSIMSPRELGINVILYTNHSFAGLVGHEIVRQHPEWCVYLRYGQPWGWSFTDLLSEWEEKGIPPQEVPQGAYMWLNGNFYYPELVEMQAEDIIRATKTFGLDGVRFDGHYLVCSDGQRGVSNLYGFDGKTQNHGEDTDELSARNMKLLKDRIKKDLPDFLFGFNYGSNWEASGGHQPKAFNEAIRDGGFYMWELGGDWRVWKTWRNYSKALSFSAEKANKVGGHFGISNPFFKPDPWTAPYGTSIFTSHVMPILIANRGHLCGVPNPGQPPGYVNCRPYMKFSARYSWFLYDTNLERVIQPDDIVKVEGSRGIIWEDYVYKRALDEKTLQYVIHLINEPVKEEIDPSEKDAPEVQNNIPMSLNLPEGYKLKDAWCLTPDGDISGNPLKANQDGKKVSLVIPRLEFWDMVVVELEK